MEVTIELAMFLFGVGHSCILWLAHRWKASAKDPPLVKGLPPPKNPPYTYMGSSTDEDGY